MGGSGTAAADVGRGGFLMEGSLTLGMGIRGPGSARLRDQSGVGLLELLVASFLGLLMMAAALHLLHGHAALALRVQADLEALDDGLWAIDLLRADLRRAEDAWPGPVEGEGTGTSPSLLALAQDLDGDGGIDPHSAESVGWALSTTGPGRILRRVGRQSMGVLDGVPRDSWRVLAFAPNGEVHAAGASGTAAEHPIVRVQIAFVVDRSPTRVELHGTAAIPVRRGRP